MATGPLELRGVSKSFGAVRALIDVSLEVLPGRVTALIGDNGAGKSTLVKCISGLLQPDSGEILLAGRKVAFANPLEARAMGIETVHQDLMLVESMDVSANLFLNREIRRKALLGRLGFIDKPAMHRHTVAVLDQLHINIPSVQAPIENLSGGQRQSIAVGRAVAWGRQIVLMDEPAAALGVEQSGLVLELIRRLSDNDIGVLLISHNMQHVIEVADHTVVLRHGRKVADLTTADVTAPDLVDLITGANRGDVARDE